MFLLATACAKQTESLYLAVPETPPDVSLKADLEPVKATVTINLPEPKAPILTSTPVVKYSNIWERILSLYALPEINNKRIEQELNWFINNPDYLARVQKRAEPYLYNIVEEIEARQIPGELALLPIIESAFRAEAYSRQKAAGLWQFIPSTGRQFGLKQNWWYDGRKDVFASTQAAVRFLQELSVTFDGDWLHAIAAYNAGRGRITRAIRKNKRNHRTTDFWFLRLPKETMSYVPRLLAVAKIFANAEYYNIPLRPIPNQPFFEAVGIDSQLDLAKAAKMAELHTDDFLMLNPGFIRWCTDPEGPHRLLIPVNKVAAFKENLAKLSADERMEWLHHKIHKGENLGLIALKYQTSVTAIRQVNRLTSNKIRAGHDLLIPANRDTVGSDIFAPGTTVNRQNSQIYIVKKGDNVWNIARKFSVSSKDIATWNDLSLSSFLQPGQILIIKKA